MESLTTIQENLFQEIGWQQLELTPTLIFRFLEEIEF